MSNKPNLRLPEPILDATPEEVARQTLSRPPKTKLAMAAVAACGDPHQRKQLLHG